MNDDQFTPQHLKTARTGARPTDNVGLEGRGDGTGASAATIPLQPQPDRPVTDGSEALVALRDRALDAEKGFATMVGKAEPSFRSVAESFRSLHDQHASIIGQLLIDRGLQPDSEGSFMGNVNQAVVTLRAFFDDIDEDVMKQVRDGEKNVLAAFDTALAAPLFGPEAGTVRRLRDELSDLLRRTRELG